MGTCRNAHILFPSAMKDRELVDFSRMSVTSFCPGDASHAFAFSMLSKAITTNRFGGVPSREVIASVRICPRTGRMAPSAMRLLQSLNFGKCLIALAQELVALAKGNIALAQIFVALIKRSVEFNS